jgi:hypothetical protein
LNRCNTAGAAGAGSHFKKNKSSKKSILEPAGRKTTENTSQYNGKANYKQANNHIADLNEAMPEKSVCGERVASSENHCRRSKRRELMSPKRIMQRITGKKRLGQ